MVVSSKCAEPRPKRLTRKLISRSWDVRQHGVGWLQRTNWNSFVNRSFKYAGVEENIVLNDSATILYVTRCLTGSQWSNLRSGLASAWPPRWQLGCSALAAVHRKSELVHYRAWRYSSPTWNRWYCMLLSETSRRLAEYACDAGHVYGSCTPSLPPWRDSRIAGASRSLHRVTSASVQPAACCRRPRLRGY